MMYSLEKQSRASRVVVIGGGLVGAETADMLGQQCEQVTIIENASADHERWRSSSNKIHERAVFPKRSQIHTSTKLLEIGDHTVTAEKTGKDLYLKILIRLLLQSE